MSLVDQGLYPMKSQQQNDVYDQLPSNSVGNDNEICFVLSTASYYQKVQGKWTLALALGGGGAVASVAGKTGAVTLVPADVSLGNVNNTADASKPVSTAQAAAIAAVTVASIGAIAASRIGAASGVAALDSGSKVPIAQVPTIPYANVSGTPVAMVASGGSHAGGLVPDPGATAGSAKYLREDGTWALIVPVGQAVAVDSFTAGGSDDTTALTNAIAYLNAAPNRAIAFTPNKIYTVSGLLTINGASNFSIFGNGATIKANNSYPVTSGNGLLFVENSSNGDIYELHTDGNRANRGTLSANLDSHNWEIFLSTKSIRFWGCKAQNGVCDNYNLNSSTTVSVLASLPTDIQFMYCQSTNAYRNNLSVVNSNRFRDYGGIYTGATGSAPQSGIDVEANNAHGVNSDLGNLDCRFYGTQSYNNAGQDFSFTTNSTVRAFDIMGSGGAAGGVVIGNANYVEINGITLDSYTATIANGVIAVNSGAGEVHIEKVRATNITTASQNLPVVNINGGAVGPITVRDVRGTACNCPLVYSGAAGAVIEDLNQNGANSGFMALIFGAGTILKRMIGVNVTGALYCAAANLELSDVSLLNPTLTGGQLFYMDTGSTGLVVRGVTVNQATAIPSGQLGFTFASPPAFASDIVFDVAGAPWTQAAAYTFSGGTTGSVFGAARPTL